MYIDKQLTLINKDRVPSLFGGYCKTRLIQLYKDFSCNKKKQKNKLTGKGKRLIGL